MAEYERGRGYSSLEDVSGSPNLSFDEQPQMAKVSLLERILTWRKYLILVLTPILLMPIAIAIEGTVSLESLWRLNLWSTFFKMRRQILVSAPLFQNHWYYELFFSFLNIQRELKSWLTYHCYEYSAELLNLDQQSGSSGTFRTTGTCGTIVFLFKKKWWCKMKNNNTLTLHENFFSWYK